MLLHEKELLIARIESGYLRFKYGDLILKIYPPSTDIAYEANELAAEAYQKAIDEDAFNEQGLLAYMVEKGVWTWKQEQDFQKLPEYIDNLKVALYEATFKSLERDKIRQFLKETRAERNKLHELRSIWNNLGADDVYARVKAQHTIINSTFLPNGKLYDWQKLDWWTVFSFQMNSQLTESQVRELVRSEPWSNMWQVRKRSNGPIFVGPMSNDQKQLLTFSVVYDNVYESPDRPSEDVINDDDMLDGWFIVQKRKREGADAQSRADKLLSNPNLARANEIFIPAETTQDVQQVEMLNSVHGSIVRKQRFNKLSTQSEVPYHQFNDVQDRLKMELAQKEGQPNGGRTV